MARHRLILMRHAKSSWNNPGLRDHDRPLNRRGYRSCRSIGLALRQAAIVPDEAVISSALRCRETWSEVKDAAGFAIDPRIEPGLYHSDVSRILVTVRSFSKPTALVLGHNPGFAHFASACLDRAKSTVIHPQFRRFPTASTAVIDFDIETWRDLALTTGKLHAFWIPRELES